MGPAHGALALRTASLWSRLMTPPPPPPPSPDALPTLDTLTTALILSAFVHEANNPLAFVFSNVEFLQSRAAQADGTLGSPDVRDALDDIFYGLNKLKDVVQELRACFDVTSQAAHAPSPLGAAVDLCVVALRQHRQEQLKLFKRIAPTLNVAGGKLHVKQAVLSAMLSLLAQTKHLSGERALSLEADVVEGEVGEVALTLRCSASAQPDGEAAVAVLRFALA